ncbi:DUF3369 domain-containing protein [Aestuariibacter sp. GS-14]|uniref:DUF3369 domain-containing protein n=1 Tax=Aestuariibacter sp. GS-14 TaxID=2590670 RepID=UPI00112C75A3|nr:DUF3369 domain-containing protein [Aestuariibacter sp. GS-14]TPV57929.1 DUF3369 domain-containing protein [Aestuariibacter sp. GS-14]
MLGDDLLFASDDESEESAPCMAVWKVLIVDDEPEIHTVTKMVLSDFEFEGKRIEFHTASSAAEAQAILTQDNGAGFAVALVDVVMESTQAGLKLVQWIRETLNDQVLRIILRTGQPGEAPEERVIRDYDINDYKNKTELTAMRLKTAMYTALRAYRDLKLIERHRQGLEKIIHATTQFIECDTLPQFASTILNQISLILGIESSDIICCAVTRDAKSGNQYKVLATNLHNKSATAIPPDIQRRIESALRQKQSVKGDDYFVSYFTTRRGMESVLYVARNDELEAVQHHLLSFFAHNIAVSHENIKLREVIRESQKELSYIIGEAVEVRSKETGSHVRRVAHISHLLALRAGQTESEAEMIKLASPLHDVGKVAIPDIVLNKPGKHNEEEAAIMRSHAKVGYDMLRKSTNPILQVGAQIAHEHHEQWNGHGYPNGLAGEQISIAGRVSAVADVFDALGSKRCYKGPWSEAEIKTYFEKQRGKQFDPALVDILLTHFDEFTAIRAQFPDLD